MRIRMFRRSFGRIIPLALIAGALAVTTHAQSTTTVFTGVTVVPMEANKALPNQTVVVTGDRITAIGPSASTRVPDGAVFVDGRGKFLMPGLAEMHGHV